MPISYANRFQQPDAVAAYEADEYAADSYASRIWQLERPVLEQILKKLRRENPGPLRLLDFACGTGRVLAVLEPLVDEAEGIDISGNMVAVAQAKCPKAWLRVGDILARPDLLGKNYDVISRYRFLLNAEPEMRRRVLCQLRTVVREPGGLLLVNIHGNSRSLRHPAILWRRWRERTEQKNTMLNEMSPAEARQLLAACGFEIVHQFGFGIMPPTLYRTPLRRIAHAVDKMFAGENGWSSCSIDMLFVCRPC